MADDEYVLEEGAVSADVAQWRYRQLVNAGFGEVEAADMALRRDVDLHRAVDLAGRCGPEMAYRILV